jgi:hypothetical protein
VPNDAHDHDGSGDERIVHAADYQIASIARRWLALDRLRPLIERRANLVSGRVWLVRS